MDLLHIKIFNYPKKIISVVYSVEPRFRLSHFVRVDDYKTVLDRPGADPSWLTNVLDIQKQDLRLAREYALKEIRNEMGANNRHISVGFEWDQSGYRCDKFMNQVLRLAGWY